MIKRHILALMFKGLAAKFAVFILSSVILIFSATYIYNYIFSRGIIQKNIQRDAQHLVLATVNKIEAVLRGVEKVPTNLARFLEDLDCNEKELLALLKSVVKNNPDIFGATIAFEPYMFKKDLRKFAPYFCKKAGRLEFKFIPYEYFYHDWYQIPKLLNKPVWSEPYYDVGAGDIVMATYSVPFYKRIGNEKKFAGIVTVDISLSWLQKMVSSIKIGKTGYAFLITQNGTFVTHPVSELIMNETIFTLAEARKDKKLRKIGRRMIKGESGYDDIKSLVTGKDCWLVYKPLPSSGWSLGVLFPKTELLSDIKRLNKTVLVLGIIGFGVIFAVIILISGSVTKPLRLLSKATEQIAQGNLDTELPVIKSKDEVGRLAESFHYMQESLKKYIKNLTETVAAKERIESELKIARDIQQGILHKDFPPFPERKEFDLYAILEPAREVGGDLYDFFFIDNDNLCFVVGDVSGKGVPAAIFMSVIKTLIKSKATQGMRPEIILTRANEDAVLNNPSFMFVTLFLGILNVKTGELLYSNAGHPPPYIIEKNRHCEPVPMTGDIVLGIMEDTPYHSKKIYLKPGDLMFLYTDGITEARNIEGELFSEERLEKVLGDLKKSDPVSVINSVMLSVKKFSKDAPQSDDITMMCIAYYGRQ